MIFYFHVRWNNKSCFIFSLRPLPFGTAHNPSPRVVIQSTNPTRHNVRRGRKGDVSCNMSVVYVAPAFNVGKTSSLILGHFSGTENMKVFGGHGPWKD